MTYAPIRRVSHYVAKYSYGIYLSHVAAICVSVYVLRFQPMPMRVAAFVALFCLLPVAFYHLVEEPMIRVGALVAKKIGAGSVPRVTENTLELEPAP